MLTFDRHANVYLIDDQLEADDIEATVVNHYRLTERYPMLNFGFQCFCGSRASRVRHFLFHEKIGLVGGIAHRFSKRVDVGLKCLGCGYAFGFGVPVPDWWWEKYDHKPGRVAWQVAVKQLTQDIADGLSDV